MLHPIFTEVIVLPTFADADFRWGKIVAPLTIHERSLLVGHVGTVLGHDPARNMDVVYVDGAGIRLDWYDTDKNFKTFAIEKGLTRSDFRVVWGAESMFKGIDAAEMYRSRRHRPMRESVDPPGFGVGDRVRFTTKGWKKGQPEYAKEKEFAWMRTFFGDRVGEVVGLDDPFLKVVFPGLNREGWRVQYGISAFCPFTDHRINSVALLTPGELELAAPVYKCRRRR